MKKLLISAGHSAIDPGASANGVTEAYIVTEFRDLVAYYLDQFEVKYISDGAKGVNLPLKDAIKLVRQADVSVEFHLNAATPAATGVETLSAPQHYKLGAQLCDVISKEMGIKNRGAKPEGSGQHSRLAFVQAGGLILELFFITNPNDLKIYQERKWLIARAVAKVLAEESRR